MTVPIEEEEVLDEAEEFSTEDTSLVAKKGPAGLTVIAVAAAIAILLSTVYIFFSFSLPQIENDPNWLVRAFQIFILLLFGLSIPFFAVLYLISRVTTGFFDRFYIPPEGTQSRELILSRLYGYGSRVPIRDEQLTERHSWLHWLGGPAGLVINDGFAVYLEKGNRFSRILGPGITHIDLSETIKTIVDLRPIVRKGVVKAWTKDGIKIQLEVRMECQIGHETGTPESSTNLVYPFNPDDVKKAVERTAVRFNSETKQLAESNWVDGVWSKVNGFLANYISSHTVDELFLAEWGTSQMLSQSASKRVFQDLNQNLAEYGARISNLQITNFSIPEEVNRQRIQTWEAERHSIETITIGQTKAYEIREREKARAEAEQEIIANIAKEMERIDFDRLQETVLLSLSGILDQSLSDPFTRTLITNETLDTLEKLKKLL